VRLANRAAVWYVFTLRRPPCAMPFMNPGGSFFFFVRDWDFINDYGVNLGSLPAGITKYDILAYTQYHYKETYYGNVGYAWKTLSYSSG
jgi:hypothetical protein